MCCGVAMVVGADGVGLKWDGVELYATSRCFHRGASRSSEEAWLTGRPRKVGASDAMAVVSEP